MAYYLEPDRLSGINAMVKKTSLLIILLLMVGFPILISSCQREPITMPVIRDINLMKLLIGLNDLPDGWRLNGEPERFSEVGASEAASISFVSMSNATRNGASFGVYNYGTSEEAARVFKKIYEPRVFDDLPPGWSNPSFFANQYKVGCYDWEGREPYACTWTAQYQEFIVQLDTWIIPNRMTFKDLEYIALAVDERMKNYLEISPVGP
jgi:hypothetical protein